MFIVIKIIKNAYNILNQFSTDKSYYLKHSKHNWRAPLRVHALTDNEFIF